MKPFAGRCYCREPHVIVNAGKKRGFPDRPWFIEFDIFGFFFGIQGKANV